MNRESPMGLLFILVTIIFTVVGQLLVKQGMREVSVGLGQATDVTQLILRAFANLKVVLGLGSAVVAALSWMVAVSHSDLSFAYPFMGLPIVLVLALSGTLFGEVVPITRWLGVGIVCVGLFIAARS
ncbi:undecaprenyl phosphate-alpha-L-ara4N flippase subunit ArnF [Anaerolineae bacterium]|nr:undecaprenyl phosphate-alpha-L-ara4N flippase subunit ArnF [Anaerolineae bacterium]